MRLTKETTGSTNVVRGRTGRSRPTVHDLRRPAPVRALTSDVWFTLLYLRPPDQRSLEKERLRIWSNPLVRAGASRSRAELAAKRLESWAAKQEATGWTPTLDDQATHLARETGIPVSGSEVGRELDDLINTSPVRVAAGAIDALAKLRNQGMHLGIVSNVLHETSAGLRKLLAEKGLLSLFSSVILSSDFPWSKPRPEPFRRVLRELGTSSRYSVHVGDLLYDVLGAQRAGVRPLLFTGLHRFEPVRLVRLAVKVDQAVERFDRWKQLPDWLPAQAVT